MQTVQFDEVVDKIVAKDSRYTRDAYFFLREALSYTQKLERKKGEVQHVTPKELLEGIRDFALAQYGPMAVTLLEEWGVRTTEDFGELVFNMVDSNLLAKTEQDSREDFKNGYDFVDAFKKPFQPSGKSASETKSVS